MAASAEALPKRLRTIRLVRSPARDGVGVFCVTVGDRSCFYTLHELPCEIGGRGFAIHRTISIKLRIRPRDCFPQLPMLVRKSPYIDQLEPRRSAFFLNLMPMGFAIHRTGLGTLYHVRVGRPEDCSCECKGFLFRSSCRHILGLLALMAKGKL